MKLSVFYILFLFACFVSCDEAKEKAIESQALKNLPTELTEVSLIVLGTVQDAGSPHIACKKACCKELFIHPDENRRVVSLGVLDHENNKKYLFEATPDLPKQMKALKDYAIHSDTETPDGIFLTHAHIGHYVGLMYLGKEAMGADNIPVYAMPRMNAFLRNNGPWSQLVENENISIMEMKDDELIELSSKLKVIPFTVPHRDEYSETVGFTIVGPNKSVLFIPDIDKWEKWETDIIEVISKVDYAFLDATFFDGEELNNRDISEIPHPFVVESMENFKHLSSKEKAKIHFIHLNHTNPVLNPDSWQTHQVIENGYNIAKIYDFIKL